MNPKRFRGDFIGSKGGSGVAHKIINLIPKHDVLIEPFAGLATISRVIRPALETILVDMVRHPRLHVDRTAPQSVRFVQGDGITFIDQYRYTGREFIYADPPYLLRARAQRGRAYYGHELTEKEHRRLLRVAKAINCNVLLSGYASPLYDHELSDWNRIEFQTVTLGGTLATEVLWFNYPRPTELHDYRFVGDCWQDRQRLRRKIRNAVIDLSSMPPLERGAMFAALSEAMDAERCARARPAEKVLADRQGENALAGLAGDPAENVEARA